MRVGVGGFLRNAFAVALFVLATALPAAALDFPALSGRVVDDANILNAQTRQELTDKLAALEAKTTSQLVVVTLKSLQGTSIEDFGVQLGRHWGIGQRGKNNGALLIVAPAERKVRIEVGYGLESVLTDALTKFIIENSILPRFKAGDMPGGIKRGTDDMITLVSGEGEEIKQHAVAQQQPKPADPLSDWKLIAAILFIVFMVGTTFYAIARDIYRGIRDSKRNGGKRHWTSYIPSSSSSSGSSWSSSSDSSFSGGGGSFGGGGSSGSW